ncbi:hypothetical protein ABZ281_49330 [Streptomyces sp. NPDC006265]|uniref:hypothetical protein n=1 Tax=Streptomyces sp. NPDC006265 TaxID=3156740 RepID=UPI0033BC76F9
MTHALSAEDSSARLQTALAARIPTGHQGYRGRKTVQYALVATTVYASDRDFDQKMQAGQATLAKSPWTTALDKYLTMQRTGCFQKNPLATDYEPSRQLAASGKTLGIVQGNWAIPLPGTHAHRPPADGAASSTPSARPRSGATAQPSAGCAPVSPHPPT